MAAQPERKGNPLAAPPPKRSGRLLALEVDCVRKDTVLELQQCLTDYVNANALKNKASPCHACPQGLDQRVAFAKGRL